MGLDLPIQAIVDERPIFPEPNSDGGMMFRTWDFTENDFVTGSADDWDVLLGFESPGDGRNTPNQDRHLNRADIFK